MSENAISVQNQNTLHIRYQELTPYFELSIHPSQLSVVESDFRIKLISTYHTHENLRFTIELKSFRTTIHFHADFPIYKTHEKDIVYLLNRLIELTTIQVQLVTTTEDVITMKNIELTNLVKTDIQFYLSNFIKTDEYPGLTESLMEIPENILIPFVSKSQHFSMLCKMDDYYFDKIKFVPSKDFIFAMKEVNNQIIFQLIHEDEIISFFGIPKINLVEEIIEDFIVLLNTKHIDIILSGTTMNYSKRISKVIDSSQVSLLKAFFINE